MADPASMEAQLEAEGEADRAAVAAELLILGIICERLGKISPGDTAKDAAIWAIEDMDAIAAAVRKGRQAISSAVASIFQKLGKGNDEWSKPFYDASGADRSAEADAALIEGRKAVQGKVGELCRTSALCIVDDQGMAHTLDERYKQVVTRAVAAMRVGEGTYQTEVARAVRELSRHGVSVRYASGATRELYAAVRANVMDGYRTTMVAQRMEHGRAFGADGVEVSAHEPCAPDHQEYQGQRYTDAEWAVKQFKPSRPLVIGANCHHTISPVIIGVGGEVRSKAEVTAMNDRSNELVTFTGVGGQKLTMKRYEATQYQRRMERAVRQAKMDAYLEEKRGNKEAAAKAKARASDFQAFYKRMSSEVGLDRRDERTRLYVLPS